MKHKNTNCLEGMRCPNCKNLGPLNIGCHVMLSVADDGTDIAEGYDIEWEDDDVCVCPGCGFIGTVKEFRVKSNKKEKV